MKKVLLFMVVTIVITMLIAPLSVCAEEQVAVGEEEPPLSTADRIREFFETEKATDILNWVISVAVGALVFFIRNNSKTNKLLSVNLEKGTRGLRETMTKIIPLEERVANLEKRQSEHERLSDTNFGVIISKLDSQSQAFLAVYGSMINNDQLRTDVLSYLNNGLHFLSKGRKQVNEKLSKAVETVTVATNEVKSLADEVKSQIGG